MGQLRIIVCAFALSIGNPAVARVPDPLGIGPHNEVINGVRLWYRVAGKTRGTPVVFLHGGPGQGSQSFAAIAGPHLEKHLRIIYLDQRGSGRSERPWDKAYSISHLVEDLEALRRTWGVEKIALIGHSVGTILAMEYGAKYPQHVDRLVLAASGPDLGAAFDLMCERVRKSDPAAYERAKSALKPGSRRSCNMWGEGVSPQGGMQRFVNGNMFPKAETEVLVNQADRTSGLRNTGELSAALIEQGILDYRFAYSERLTMPVLVIAGRRDLQAAIEPQRDFVTRLPRGVLSEWSEAGHFMFAEEPDRFAKEVSAFLLNTDGWPG